MSRPGGRERTMMPQIRDSGTHLPSELRRAEGGYMQALGNVKRARAKIMEKRGTRYIFRYSGPCRVSLLPSKLLKLWSTERELNPRILVLQFGIPMYFQLLSGTTPPSKVLKNTTCNSLNGVKMV